MFKWLLPNKKKKITEDNVELPKSADNLTDEVTMCKRCPFVYKCTFEEGCASLKAALAARSRTLSKLRGFVKPNNKQNQVSPEKQQRTDLKYLIGLNWRDYSDHGSIVTFRVVEISGGRATLSVVEKPRDRGRDNGQFRQFTNVVEVPVVKCERGYYVVDMYRFKKHARMSLSVWTPGK